MPDLNKELTITLHTVADLGGARQLDEGLRRNAQSADAFGRATSSVKEQVLAAAQAKGADEAAMQKLGAVYDDLTAKFTALEQAAKNGTITNEEALKQWAQAQGEAAEKVKGLGAAVHGAGENMEGARHKARIMSEMMAGLTVQFALGADGSEMFASSMGGLGAVFATMGPIGMAAGVGIQALTAIILKSHQETEKAEKADAQRVQRMREMITEINNARAAEQSWQGSIKRTIEAMDAQIAAMGRRQKAEAEDRAHAAEQAQLDREIAQQERDAKVASGEMSPDDAAYDKMVESDTTLDEQHQSKLKDIAAKEKNATNDKEAAQLKQQVDEESAKIAAARADALKEAETARKQMARANADIQKAEQQAGQSDTPIPQEEMDRLIKNQKRAQERNDAAQRGIMLQEQDTGPYPRDREGQIDVSKAFGKAKEDQDKAEAGRGKSQEAQLNAQAEIDSAQSDRENENQEHYKRQQKYRNTLPPELQSDFDNRHSNTFTAYAQRKIDGKDEGAAQGDGIERVAKAVEGAMPPKVIDGMAAQVERVTSLSAESMSRFAQAISNLTSAFGIAVQTAQRALSETEKLRAEQRGAQ